VPDNSLFAAKTKGLSQVEISITDSNGNPVFNAANEITVSVSGPGKLIGLESGSTNSHEDYKGSQRKALNGRLLAYIQTNGSPGKIQVTVPRPV
jgi:beta-galactosidase